MGATHKQHRYSRHFKVPWDIDQEHSSSDLDVCNIRNIS
jgi:hypothetical protein